MKIIFLDDSDSRCAAFRSKVPPSDIVHTAAECIALIKASPDISWLFLDHDLGGEVLVNSDREDCGMEVVRFLCENDRSATITNIVVHSHNIVAAEQMHEKLIRAGYNSKLLSFHTMISLINFVLPPAST